MYKKKDSKVHQILESNISGSILLLICTVIAIVLANSPFRESVDHFWHTMCGITVGDFKLDMSLAHWINDGLMAIFFFVVGLEIKREVMAGELSSPKQAIFPALGAIGGMVIPALFYIYMTKGTDAMSGWGVPMATDIAFSLGILNLLGKRVPVSLKIFLVALAIVDDLGAILVIAFFYSSSINLLYLFVAFVFLAILIVASKLKVRNPWIYFIIGALVWYYFLISGIHATIAGVLIALTIPIKRGITTEKFNELVANLKVGDGTETKFTLSDPDIHNIDKMKSYVNYVVSPVQNLEHSLHKIVNFLIMPLFALANAGVYLGVSGDGPTFNYLAVAITVSLLFGKTIGITLFTWLGVKLKIAELPAETNWKQIISTAVLGGLGFTMSIFISTLAFGDNMALLSPAKIGVMTGSLLSGVIGYLLLKKVLPKK